jgi:pilus assembly protein CpaD
MSSTHLPVVKLSGANAARLLAIVGGAAMLAGCYTDHLAYSDEAATAPMTNDYRQRHPISIEEGAHTVELFIGGKRGGLTTAQRADVLAFAHEWHREATGGILIDLPAGTSNEAAAANALPEVRSLLVAAGVPPDGIDVRPYRPATPHTLATIRLNFPKMVAHVGPCGLWPQDLGPTFDRQHLENTEYWNFGCATQRDLAAMVDNPADLAQPRGEAPTSTGHRSAMLDKYRRGEPTATAYPNADQGKISDVGK